MGLKLKRIAVAAIIITAVAFAVVVIVVSNLDPRELALRVAASVKQDTGRELTFGNVGVKLFPRPAITLSEIRLGNTTWGSQPWMATAARADAEISVLPLFSGKLQISRVDVSDASLLLETDAAGDGNWVMRMPAGGRPDWLGRLEIDALEFKPFTITWRNGVSGRVVRFPLDVVTVHAPAAAEPIRFNVRTSVAGAQAKRIASRRDGSVG